MIFETTTQKAHFKNGPFGRCEEEQGFSTIEKEGRYFKILVANEKITTFVIGLNSAEE